MNRGALARALGLVALCVGFYACGVAVVALLLWLPWAQATYEHKLGLTGIACGAAGLWLLIGLVPRPAPFRMTGLPLDRAEHAALHALIADVARRTEQVVPDAVYLVPEASAFTGVQRAWFGLKRTRVVAVGLPLLATLTRNELASVIAHELGHHHGGDLRVQPWIASTRRAIARTLESSEGSLLWLHLPFVWYARWFLRITFKVSREQELAADALAARSVGKHATASALARVHELAPQWSVYWEQEVVPLLERGKRPPLIAGFRTFQREASAQPALLKAFNDARDEATSEHDTHPSLSDRLLALGVTDVPAPGPGDAWALLDEASDPESRALASVIQPDACAALTTVEWSEVPCLLWLPLWRQTLSIAQRELSTLTLDNLPHVLRDRPRIVVRPTGSLSMLSPEARVRRFVSLAGTWLSVQLSDQHGFTVDTWPGGPVRLVRGSLVVEPHRVVEQLVDGTLSSDAYDALRAAIVQVSVPTEAMHNTA